MNKKWFLVIAVCAVALTLAVVLIVAIASNSGNKAEGADIVNPSTDAAAGDAEPLRFYVDGTLYEIDDPAATLPPDAVSQEEYEEVHGTTDATAIPLSTPKASDSSTLAPGVTASPTPKPASATAAATSQPTSTGGSSMVFDDDGDGSVIVDFDDLFGDNP
ncbi:MAG TPA: hypothetical protein P5116_02000 [Eubacteriales bacterium]|nr:hypothetical protein [Eubacteriales bacterium]